MKKINQIIELLSNASLEVYKYLGWLNFDEKDFQIALGYELEKKNIDYLRETHIQLYYKDIPIKLGAPDFYLNNINPPTIIEIKLGSNLNNSNRQQLKMYMISIKRNPKSILKKVKNGVLINFLKEDPTTYEPAEVNRKKELYKIEIEHFSLDKNNKLKLLDNKLLGKIN